MEWIRMSPFRGRSPPGGPGRLAEVEFPLDIPFAEAILDRTRAGSSRVNYEVDRRPVNGFFLGIVSGEDLMANASRKVLVGMMKAMPAKWDAKGNFAIFESLFLRHAKDGLDVFITPECFLDGYAVTEPNWTPARFRRVAQAVGRSEILERVSRLARRARTHVVFGFSERLRGEFRNTALLLGRRGELLGTYHKTHLQAHDRRFVPGQDLPVFPLDFGCAGIAICADRRWPETIRTLRLKGAEIVLMPTYGMWHLDNEWWMRTRSYENEMFVCFTHPNVALITGPKGGVEAKLQSSVPDVLVHEVDLARVTETGHLQDRRPELYGILSDTGHPSRQKAYTPDSK
jgi:predicted amidohydrolase